MQSRASRSNAESRNTGGRGRPVRRGESACLRGPTEISAMQRPPPNLRPVRAIVSVETPLGPGVRGLLRPKRRGGHLPRPGTVTGIKQRRLRRRGLDPATITKGPPRHSSQAQESATSAGGRNRGETACSGRASAHWRHTASASALGLRRPRTGTDGAIVIYSRNICSACKGPLIIDAIDSARQANMRDTHNRERPGPPLNAVAPAREACPIVHGNNSGDLLEKPKP